MSANLVPGCCGIVGCRGCAWECTQDAHDYVPSAVIDGRQTWVCDHCGNVTPALTSPNIPIVDLGPLDPGTTIEHPGSGMVTWSE